MAGSRDDAESEGHSHDPHLLPRAGLVASAWDVPLLLDGPPSSQWLSAESLRALAGAPDGAVIWAGPGQDLTEKVIWAGPGTDFTEKALAGAPDGSALRVGPGLDLAARDDYLDADGEAGADDEAGRLAAQSLASGASRTSTAPSTSGGRRLKATAGRARRQRPPWTKAPLSNEVAGMPASRRRYFDCVPSEFSISPRQPVRDDTPQPLRSRVASQKSTGRESQAQKGRPHWVGTHHLMASEENFYLHPLRRHYFNRRGQEASYRARPWTDHEWLQQLPPTTPRRPSDSDLRMKYSVSEPSLTLSSVIGVTNEARAPDPLDVHNRSVGNLRWQTRCLLFGPDEKVQRLPTGERMPWISDHHISESLDNAEINPRDRHYFDKEGMETSFRNRGRHYGRPAKPVFDDQASTCSTVSKAPAGGPSGQGRPGRREKPPTR